MAQHGKFKALSPLQQRFKLSSACQILSFFLNKVLICLETLRSSPAAVPVALGEHRVGSLPLSPARRTKRGPSSFSLWGQWCRRREEEPDTEQRTWNDPTPRANTSFSLQTTQNRITGTCFGKDEVLPGWATLQTSSQQRPSAGPCFSRQFTSNHVFSCNCIKRQNTSRYPPLPPHQRASISPWKWTKSHYLIGKAIWHAASREQQQQLQRSISLGGLLWHNLNALVA